jgi:protein SCO1/2
MFLRYSPRSGFMGVVRSLPQNDLRSRRNNHESAAGLALLALAFVIVALALPGSASGVESDSAAVAPTAAASTATNIQIYQARGVVKELPPGGRSVVIKHEEVTNYMPAMTMEFRPADTNELRGLAPRDRITFRILVTEDTGWIDQITRIGKEQPAAPSGASSRPVVYAAPLKVGALMPDCVLTNELGHVISLSQYRGQALALTFFFTRCPFPDFCPRMSNQFADTARKLAATPGGPTNWHLLSISFDPGFDSPAVLRGYAQGHQYDPARWSFATGSPAEIEKLAQRCDLTVQRDGAGFTHNLRTVVVDADGRVKDVLIGNEWTADELAKEMVAAAAVSTNSPAEHR